MIVIVIIGILATALIPRLTRIQANARDTKRLVDLRQVQAAIQFYYNINNKYPDSGGAWRGNCSGRGSHPVTGPDAYIPNFSPEYMTSLPLDPKPAWASECYLYKSNGNDYMFLMNRTVEGKIPDELRRQLQPTNNSFAIHSPGAAGW